MRDLARQILDDADRSAIGDREPTADGAPYDRTTWRALADAGLVAAGLGTDLGGSGLGFLAVHLVLEEIGAAGVSIPYWPTVVLAALPIDAHGGGRLRGRLLEDVAAGTLVATAALVDDQPCSPRRPRTTAVRTGDGWRLDGTKTVVPLAPAADAVVVSATDHDGEPLVAVVDTTAPGVEVEDQATISGLSHGRVHLDGVVVDEDDVLGGRGVLEWVLARGRAGLASMQAGACRTAVALTADHAGTREQFGRPIGTFQAVNQRVADAHIAAEGVRLTALEAAWRLDAGEDAGQAVSIAAWWAAQGSHEVLAAAHHLHGGVGVDLDYPLHRYFLATKQHEFALGTAEVHLSELGAAIAESSSETR